MSDQGLLNMQQIIIAIDGYSGTGKSSTAKKVAEKLDYTYIDSGAMYRAATLYFIESNIDVTDREVVKKALKHLDIAFKDGRVLLNNRDVSREIRTMAVNQKVSEVSALSEVREAMVDQQRKLGSSKSVVMDGRDIGSIVFPDAELKVFMTADVSVRARRRKKELAEKGIDAELEEIENNLQERDNMDSSRAVSPLIKADESIEIDTSDLTFAQQVDKVIKLAEALIYEN